ncbi:hypothetical protein AN189_18510 [Loktanella sp. 3ANDIMAR09]|nr:hypothetical protein AN189_18510 [Loktanella sp. 3ANDIMAR09]
MEAQGQMAGDVLEEAELGSDFVDDTCNIGPEVPGVVVSAPVARQGERLARISGSDDMNAATPRAAVEGFEIVPDRSRSQGRVRHPCHESGRGETVSLDITHSAISGFCEVKAEIQSADTGAKADAAKVVMSFGGTKSHTRGPFHRDRVAWVRGSSGASGD